MNAPSALPDPEETGRLMVQVYDQLRAIAARQLAREHMCDTLQPTALVHEAWMRLAAASHLHWNDRAHFFRLAARAMRQVLIDAARRRHAERRGGDWQRITLHTDIVDTQEDPVDVLELHKALERLGEMDSSLEQLIELRFFGGLTVDDAAAALGISPRKAAKDWAAARLWLRRELKTA